jgi:addiction module HigA family antidote
MATLPNTHPGEVLREEFLRPLGITPYRLAKEIGVPQTRVSGILAGKRAISVDTAVRLARYFGTTPQLWLNLQNHHDLEVAQVEAHERYDQIIPFAQTSAHAAPLTEETPRR